MPTMRKSRRRGRRSGPSPETKTSEAGVVVEEVFLFTKRAPAGWNRGASARGWMSTSACLTTRQGGGKLKIGSQAPWRNRGGGGRLREAAAEKLRRGTRN